MTRVFLLSLISYSLNCYCCFSQTTSVDTGKITILNYNETEFPFLKNCRQANLSNADFASAEEILRKFIYEYNAEQTRQFKSFTADQQNGKILLLLDLNILKRQYIPVTNQSGEKEIWVNCFCNSLDKDWKKEVIKSCGERMCNFKIMLNLTLNKYHNFRLLPVKNGI